MFWKKHTEPVPVAVSADDVEQPQTAPLTTEEAARLWFKEKTGQAMPEEFKTWLRQLAHDEAVRVTTQTSVLDRAQIMKLHEAKRLAATKLDNVEQSIEAVRRKQDWVARFTELNIRLEESKTALYEAGKQNAAQRVLQQELERYELFEPIMATYHRHRTLQQELQDTRTTASLLKRQATEAEAAAAQAKTRADAADKLHTDAENNLNQVMDTLAEGFKLDGITETLEWSDKTITAWHKEQQAALDTTRREAAALEAEAGDKERTLTALRARLQAIEPHDAMLRAGGAIMARLDQLHNIDRQRETLRRQASSTGARQRDLNDRLTRLFEQDQALVGELRTLQGEVQMHRQSNHGQDGTRLQARTMELKARRQRLLMAEQLWTRICTLYRQNDERKQALERINIHLEQDEDVIDRLTSELRQLRQSAEQRRYTYTVSKSQNVIKLRADLREGTPCSVCGAVNHPYHSDTMLEQNKLMSEWKTEAEMLDSEMRGKEQQLDALRMKHASEQGQYAAEQEMLRASQEEYRNICRGWAQYADLDRTFHDCNPAMGSETRTTMLEQLIENTDKQAADAQKELDTYNYHQLAINRATEQIDDKENRRTELAVALNETNTGCQVMAGGVERIQARIADLTTTYTTILGELDAIISLPDWAAQWRQGHENFKLDLRRRMDERRNLIRFIADKSAELGAMKERLEGLRHIAADQEARMLMMARQIENTATRHKETSNTYARLFGGDRAAEVYNRTLKQVNDTARDSADRHAELQEAQARHKTLAGQANAALEATARLEHTVAELRGQMDEWIRNFNTSHPPVQYAELERVFQAGRDWSEQRGIIRETIMRYRLAQAKEEDLRSAILGLQADESRAMDSKGETAEALIAQRETLERKRRDIMHEIADIDQRLQAHERALKQLDAMQQDMA